MRAAEPSVCIAMAETPQAPGQSKGKGARQGVKHPRTVDYIKELARLREDKKHADRVLTMIRCQKRNADRKHSRLVKKASSLSRAELLQIATLKSMDIKEKDSED